MNANYGASMCQTDQMILIAKLFLLKHLKVLNVSELSILNAA